MRVPKSEIFKSKTSFCVRFVYKAEQPPGPRFHSAQDPPLRQLMGPALALPQFALRSVDSPLVKFMMRAYAILATVCFLFIAPGTIAGLIPWWLSRWRMHAPLLGFSAIRILGVLLIMVGIPLLIESFARFALQGLGTPAPIFPTQHLVISGLYRYVRNPMYIGVCSVIVGQGLFLGDLNLLWYAVVVATGFHLFVLAYEEPTLRRTFGEEYEVFCANVPRWIPRLRAWRGATFSL